MRSVYMGTSAYRTVVCVDRTEAGGGVVVPLLLLLLLLLVLMLGKGGVES